MLNCYRTKNLKQLQDYIKPLFAIAGDYLCWKDEENKTISVYDLNSNKRKPDINLKTYFFEEKTDSEPEIHIEAADPRLLAQQGCYEMRDPGELDKFANFLQVCCGDRAILFNLNQDIIRPFKEQVNLKDHVDPELFA